MRSRHPRPHPAGHRSRAEGGSHALAARDRFDWPSPSGLPRVLDRPTPRLNPDGDSCQSEPTLNRADSGLLAGIRSDRPPPSRSVKAGGASAPTPSLDVQRHRSEPTLWTEESKLGLAGSLPSWPAPRDAVNAAESGAPCSRGEEERPRRQTAPLQVSRGSPPNTPSAVTQGLAGTGRGAELPEGPRARGEEERPRKRAAPRGAAQWFPLSTPGTPSWSTSGRCCGTGCLKVSEEGSRAGTHALAMHRCSDWPSPSGLPRMLGRPTPRPGPDVSPCQSERTLDMADSNMAGARSGRPTPSRSVGAADAVGLSRARDVQRLRSEPTFKTDES